MVIFEIPDTSGLTCKIPDPTGKMLKLFEECEMIQHEKYSQLMPYFAELVLPSEEFDKRKMVDYDL